MNMNMIRKGALLCLWALLGSATLAVSASATTWYVGPTRTYTTPCQLNNAGVLADGDMIIIAYSPSTGPGIGYYDDTCNWTTNNLTLIGVLSLLGARPVLNCAGLTDSDDRAYLGSQRDLGYFGKQHGD